jgi:hypothetical protein
MIAATRDLATFATVVALAPVIALSGCGGGGSNDNGRQASDQAAVRKVLSALQTASRAGDGRRICDDIFTPKLSNSVRHASKSGSCAKEVRSKLFSPSASLSVEHVTVSDPSNATATVKEANGNKSTVFLVKQSGHWRIRSVQAA